ncbi:unnamed protein product [Lepidochelys kempii]
MGSALFQLLANVYTLYSLAVQQLSKQDRFDFGLRALTSLLRYAGKKLRVHPDITNKEVRCPRDPALGEALGPCQVVSGWHGQRWSGALPCNIFQLPFCWGP